MGMSTHIKAFIPDTDPEYKKHRDILVMCANWKVGLPPETAEYFNSKTADINLLEEKIEMELYENAHYVKWSDEDSQGFEVDLTKLPKGVTKLRFYNNW